MILFGICIAAAYVTYRVSCAVYDGVEHSLLSFFHRRRAARARLGRLTLLLPPPRGATRRACRLGRLSAARATLPVIDARDLVSGESDVALVAEYGGWS